MSPRTVNETRAQFAYGDLKAPPTDAIGPAVSIAGVASFGTLSGSPTRRLNTMYQVVNTLSHQAGAHALRAGVDFVFNDDTITYPRSFRGNYAFSSLAELSRGQLQRLHPDVRRPGGVADQSEHRDVCTGRVASRIEPDAEPWPSLRPAIPGADQHRYQQRVAEGRVRVVAVDVARISWSAAVPGLFFDRVPLRAVANAILSAGNTTDLANLHQPSVSGLIPTQAGAPTFPNILPAQILTTTLVDFTTMDRNLQNAYSRQASVEVERVLAAGLTASVGYQYLRGENLLMSVNQNVPTCVAAGTNNGCRPNATYRNNSQYSSVGRFDLSRAAPLARATADDLGERPHQLHAVEVDEQRRRGVLQLAGRPHRHHARIGAAPTTTSGIVSCINGTVNTSMAPATTAWEHISHGFQVSSLLQYYSALPFNITSGVANLQGTTSRPLANGATAAAELRRAGGRP